MPVPRILSRLAICTGLSRKSHRRQFARSFSPGLVRLEQLEQKVLLSATTIDDTTADVIVDAMESPSVDQSANYDDYADSYSDVDYYETVLSSPVGEDYGDYADEYYAQETAALDAVSESYEAGATDTQPHMPNSTADEDADDEDTINDDLVNDTTQRLDEVIPGADRDADDDQGAQSPAEPTPSPFEFPAEVIHAFEPLTPPIQETSDNLFLVQPDGTESFETVITTQSAVTADASDDEHAQQSLPTTDLEREVTLQQTWNDTDDWTIHQSVTNRFDRESATTDEEGDDQNNGRRGSETLSVTVINGTTTVTSWSISNTQTFRTGTIPGQQDDDTFAIPEEWITAATTSVNKEDEEATDDDPVDKPPGDKNAADEDQTAVPQQEDESGSSIRTTNDLSVTTTQTLITLPDGAQGMTITSTVGWSASFTWKDGGRFSSDESDLPEDFPDELSGMTHNSSFRYNAYVTASIATSFTVTATVPLLSDGVPDLTAAEFETAFGFAVSGMAGGSSKATTKADLETRTGDEADETDERLIVRVDDQQAASGSMGFSFYIISGSEELSDQSSDDGPAPSAVQYSPNETAGETKNPTDPKPDKDEGTTDGGGDSPDDTDRDSNDDRPPAGSASAGELLAGETPGVQFTLDASSSSSDTKSHTFEEKIRSATADYRTFTETTLTETTETTSDGGFGVAVGTQENSFRISSSGSDSEEVNSSLTWWQDGYDSSNDPHGDDDGYGSEVWEVSTFDGTSESDYDFEISIGGSSGATFTNDSSFFVEWTETEKISDIPEETGEESGYLTTTAYRNGSADDIERVDRRSTEFFSPDGNFEFIEYDQVPDIPITGLLPDENHISTQDLEIWFEDWNDAPVAASGDQEGKTLSAVDSAGVPINGYVDPESEYVYDEHGTLVGRLNEDGHVYWPADWPEDYQDYLEAAEARRRILNRGHGVTECSTEIVAGVFGARKGAGLLRTVFESLAAKSGEAVAPKTGVQANKAAGDAVRDAIAAREAPAVIEQSLKTIGGIRRVDVLKLGDDLVAFESKVGRTALTSRVRQELARDWHLLRQGKVQKVIWEFSRSEVTGKLGPTTSLLAKLQKLGIQIIINN